MISHCDGILRADNFDDLYFSADNGLEESQHVFIDGNHIADRISNAAHFTIAETGFGTGLNFLAGDEAAGRYDGKAAANMPG